ncbi:MULTISPECIES: PAC2 family protein [Actinoallomurus]|uniref:PAC2 family protein n=1 Tax=Actinoallomurus TaxID=667113 RepID=UPI0020928FA1|nr:MULTISPECIES: PAC2 family protein [Actinoallomurus]MCO5974877.1 PAC2 family protein [Actinoallomurus soli]MCO5997131.1 PAC2 family protein [Actinoallomurus rhizosphaericola]
MVELDDVPELVDPVVIAAFEGWNDAGEAASGVVRHLEDIWDATPLAALDPDDYYDFQVTRPTVEMVDGQTRRISWPTTRLSVAKMPGSDRDVVLIHGIEPNMRWRAFCRDLVGIMLELNARTVVLLGALLADAPHTRPVPVTAASSDAALTTRLQLEPARYEGPTGVLGVLQDACAKADLETVSLWAAVPHYVAQPPSPKATLALLRWVEDVLDISVSLGELPEQARAWEHGVNELAEQDTEVAEYVRALEEQKDATELPEASGDAIAREFERYLRRRGDAE